MKLEGKKVLVTGGAGFIGRNLLEKLAEKKCKVRILDTFPDKNQADVSQFGAEVFDGDIRDPDVVAKAVKDVDGVVHLAAQTSVIRSIKDPELDFEINVKGTLNLLKASAKSNVKRFVFASSIAVLGEQNPPLKEDMVPMPISPYGASKLAGEGYCNAYANSYGLSTISLRFSNVYGEHAQKGVIPEFVKRSENGVVRIYGDGKQTRDFVYVGDVCNAIILSLENSAAGILHIGSGRETNLLELADIVRKVTKNDFEILFDPFRKGEIRRSFCSILAAKDVLKYEPKTSLQNGVKKYCEWLQ